ncbi:hypothetical protein [Trinickia acidisoli]|uniref:hypothetical protein n=1 Tax=Trinickia acidisoli TaxID=2767482 RepID=UPI001A900E25
MSGKDGLLQAIVGNAPPCVNSTERPMPLRVDTADPVLIGEFGEERRDVVRIGDRKTGGSLALAVWMDYMRQALKGAPEYEMPTPADVVSTGGELYFDTFLPGQGFVDTVGISEPTLHAEATKAATNNDASKEMAGREPALAPRPEPSVDRSIARDIKRGT